MTTTTKPAVGAMVRMMATTVRDLARERRNMRDQLLADAGDAALANTYQCDIWIGDEIPFGAEALRVERARMRPPTPLDDLEQMLGFCGRFDTADNRAVLLVAKVHVTVDVTVTVTEPGGTS